MLYSGTSGGPVVLSGGREHAPRFEIFLMVLVCRESAIPPLLQIRHYGLPKCEFRSQTI